MDDGALDDALETGGRLRILLARGGKIGEVGIDVADQVGAQLVEIDAAGLQHGQRVLILRQRQQEVFQRGIFVPPFVGWFWRAKSITWVTLVSATS